MNIIKGKRQQVEAERLDDVGGGTLSRRTVLSGIAALPVLYGFRPVTPALAATVARPGSTSARGTAKATDDLVRGVERRYNAPLLTRELG
jgi:hypothetical protein